ncbi:MAG: glutathione S-transferase N-terminal domain-containing protein [Pseudomonadota bacterium]
MDKVTLYGIAVSAFVAKVRIALDLKGVAYDELPPPEGYGSAAYRAIIPAGSVPGLVHGAVRLSDSNAIIEYLDERFAGMSLLPESPAGRAAARLLMGFHDTRLEAAARALFPLIKAGGAASPAAVEAGVAEGVAGIEAALERLRGVLEGLAEAPGMGEGARAGGAGSLGYPVTLQMARMMAQELGRPLHVPEPVSGWVDETAALPAVARSLSIARQAMEAWMAGFRA